MDNVHLLVLKVTLSNENDVSSGHPNLFPHLAANVTEAGHSVEAEAFTATVAKHPDDLGVLLSFLLEFEFTLRLLSISLSPTPIFPSFSLGFRHGNNVAVPFLSSIQVVAFLIWWAALFVLFMIHKRATEQDDEMVCVRHDLIT